MQIHCRYNKPLQNDVNLAAFVRFLHYFSFCSLYHADSKSTKAILGHSIGIKGSPFVTSINHEEAKVKQKGKLKDDDNLESVSLCTWDLLTIQPCQHYPYC